MVESSNDRERTPQAVTIETIMPPDMAARAEESGIRRASMDLLTLSVLSVLAGAFISFGAIFATTVSAGMAPIIATDGETVLSAGLPYGVARLLTGAVFSLGLILVVVGGAELFTGNNLIVMAWASGKVKTRSLLLNWLVAFIGNCVGAVATAGLMFYTTQYTFGAGAVGLAGVDDGQQQSGARLRSCIDAWDYVQRVGVSRSVDVLQRPHHDRPGRHDRPSDYRICRRGLRTQHCERLFHSDGTFHQGGSRRHVLEFDWQDHRGFSGPHLDQFSLRQSHSGNGWQYHRRIGAGRSRILVRIFTEAETARLCRPVA